jgi:Holliday junction DNA helicase RuvA
LTPDDLSLAIAAQDKAAITRAPGVGPKLGARIVAELKDKAGSIGNDLTIAAVNQAAANGSGKAAAGPVEDATSALVNLGYRRTEAFTAVAKAARELGAKATLDGLIRAGLKELSQ